MNACLPLHREAAPEQMGVEVAAEEEYLEKEQAGRPDRCAAPVPGENHPAHHRLHGKEQERAEGDGDGVPCRMEAFDLIHRFRAA